MFERKAAAFNKPMGFAAFVWRLALTTGTGSIFGFLVARQAYDAAIMAPMFIVMSFAFGLAIFMLFLMFTFDQDDRALGDKIVTRLKNLLGVFIAGALLLVIAYHLTKMYGTKNHGVETFILLEGGVYTKLFWFGQILIGSLLPLGILYHPALGKSRGAIVSACVMVILGGLSAIYVIVIGGQAFPMQMFPGKTIIASGFQDGVNGVAFQYIPTMPEILMGVGGFALAIMAATIAVRMLKFLPVTLADKDVDPHA
jgi:molybdopterin-containing oxidoreductase family membrane subunit